MCIDDIFKLSCFLLKTQSKGIFLKHFFQNCFICSPADYTVSEDAGIEPRGLNFKELLHNKLRFTWGWAEVLSMAHIVHILNRLAWLELFSLSLLCVCVSLLHCKHPVAFLCVTLHSASLDRQWPTDTDEYQPMPERLRKDFPNFVRDVSGAIK